MTRETKRLFVFGRPPPDANAELEAEAIELKRRADAKKKAKGEATPAASAMPSADDAGARAAGPLDDDDDTVALPLALRARAPADDAATVVRKKGVDAGRAQLGPGVAAPVDRTHQPREGAERATRRVVRKGGAAASDARSARARAGVGATVRMAPEDHPPADDERNAQGGTPVARVVGTRDAAGGRTCPACGLTFSSLDVLFCPFDGDRLVAAASWDLQADPLLGKTIAERYEIQEVLAEGSMGTVYRVRHARLGTQFALKVLRRDLAREKDLAARLVDEARATAAIGHPNIVAVTDFGEIGSELVPDLADVRLPYFVMELLAGESLSDALQRGGPMSPARVARIAHQCSQALAAAHAAGIVHRDLKPGNIRLLPSLRGDVVKILDFGVAKILGSSRRTKVGTVFGTPHYMSPEQGRGHEIDHRTDVYSLGVIMYQCLTGRVPFEADTYMGVVTKHLFARPEPIRVGGAVDDAEHRIEPVVMRCLEKEAANRYETMEALARDLDAVLAGEPSDAERALRGGDRFRLREKEPMAKSGAAEVLDAVPGWRPHLPWIAAGLAVAAVVALGWWWRPWARAPEPGSATPAPSGLPTAPPGAGASAAPMAVAGPPDTTTADAATSSAANDDPAPPARGRTRPAASAASRTVAPEPTRSAAAAASTEPEATPPPPPRPKPTATRHGDVVDPWR